MKILIILGVIFAVFLIGTSLALRYVKNLLGISIKRFNQDEKIRNSRSVDSNVIYQKDDVVVMKGDAKDKH